MNRIHAIDGVKMIAIISIILYHLWPHIFSGGFLFVNTFLVISGYFAASKLEQLTFEHDFRKLGQYLIKTLDRLWIPLFWITLIIMGFLLYFNPSLLGTLRGDIISSLIFTSNIFQLASERSYFADMAVQSPFTHLWYIAIHVQSLIASVIIILVTNYKPIRREFKVLIWMIIVLGSHLTYIMMYDPNSDPTNVYYGFITRFSSFAGGILVYYFEPFFDRFMNEFDYALKQTSMMVLTMLMLLVMVGLSLVITDMDPTTYQVWLSYFNIASMIFVLASRYQDTLVKRLFDNKIVSYFGNATYSHYLWYYPVIVFGSSYIRAFDNVNVLHLITFVAVLCVSYVFYLIIEKKLLYIPFLTQLDFKKDFNWVKSHPLRINNLLFPMFLALFVVGIKASGNNKPLALVQLEYNFYQNQPNVGNLVYPEMEYMSVVQGDLIELDEALETDFMNEYEFESPVERAIEWDPQPLMEATSELGEENQAIFEAVIENNPDLFELLDNNEVLFAATTPVTFFGDSLILLAGDTNNTLFFEGNTFGYESLQVWDSYPYIEELMDNDELNENVVVNLGTNAGLDDVGMETLIDMVGDREVYLVSTNSAVGHRQEVNDVIDQMVEEYPNVHLVDWYEHSQGHPEYYDGDDIHLSPEGKNEYAALVVRTMMDVENSN